jgi:hypothetical protein
VSVIVIVPDVATLPVLLTAMVYVPVPPAVNEPVWVLVIASAGNPEIVVGSVPTGVLVAPPPLAVAELVTEPGGPTTLTVSVMGLPAALAAMTVVLVHVAPAPEPVHDQPVPLAALKVKPAGSVSVTLIVPDVAAVPVLLTAIVYVPVPPTVKVPVWVFVIESTGRMMVVGSVATGVLLAPPPAAFALFVTDAGALAATLTVSVMGLPAALAAMAVVLVHVAVTPEPVHDQPVPVAAL